MTGICGQVIEIGICESCGPDEVYCALPLDHPGDHEGTWGHGGGKVVTTREYANEYHKGENVGYTDD